MRVFPWLTEEFHSPLAPAELLLRVASITVRGVPMTFFGRPDTSAIFEGVVPGHSFSMRRITNGKESTLRIEGIVRLDYANGSRLRLRHRLSWIALIFASVWLGSMGSLAVALLHQGSAFAMPLGAFVFGLLVIIIPFWLEVDKSRPLLIQLLKLEKT